MTEAPKPASGPDGGPLLAPVPRQVLRHAVLDRLRLLVLRGELAPGTRLHEASLAAQFGVSRGPVREAFRHLEQEGLVEITPHLGAVVVGLPEDEVASVFRVRAELESLVFARAAERVTDADLDELEVLVEDMLAASRKADFEELSATDMAFHGRVVEISGYRLLRRMWSSINGLVRLRTDQDVVRTWTGLDTADLEADTAGHWVLVEALRSRDPERASAAARHHVTESIGAPTRSPVEEPVA